MRLLFPGGRWTELALESTAVRSITHRIASRGLTPAPEQRVLHCSALRCSALRCTAPTAPRPRPRPQPQASARSRVASGRPLPLPLRWLATVAVRR